MPLSSLATAILGNIVTSILGSITDAPADDYYPQPEYSYPAGESAIVGRTFPAGTGLGVLAGPPDNGMVVINGKYLRTAPGLQIRNEQNRIVQATMMDQRQMKVRYQLDSMGNAWRIWILTQAEVAEVGRSFNVQPTLPGYMP